MSILDVLNSIHLHDSIIEEIRYSPEIGEMSLRITVCRYDGDGLGPDDAEVIRFLVFSDVQSFSLKPSDLGRLAHDEILRTTAQPLPDGATVTDFRLCGRFRRDIATLQIVAASAEVRSQLP